MNSISRRTLLKGVGLTGLAGGTGAWRGLFWKMALMTS
ncbi:twin-arginine translocation signal domain-containing protein [Photobacterium profundum]|nr:twin-arginine translocation signal domain-containing protein [Photobacterium profundum]